MPNILLEYRLWWLLLRLAIALPLGSQDGSGRIVTQREAAALSKGTRMDFVANYQYVSLLSRTDAIERRKTVPIFS